MARIAGVNLPNQKRLEIGLTYIYGIGQPSARKICAALEPVARRRRSATSPTRRSRSSSATSTTNYQVEGDLRRERQQAIKRLVEIGAYRGHPPPARPAGERAADEDERAHPQGPEEDRRPREEGEVTWRLPRRSATRGRTRRRVKKNIAIGQAHIKTSFNNTIVSLTDKEGNVIVWESAGSAGFKGSRKSTPFAAQVTADAAARKGMEHGLQKVEVFVKGPGSGRETAIRSLQAAGLEILGVRDVTPQAHNGVRQKKRRRVSEPWPATAPRSASSAAARG